MSKGPYQNGKPENTWMGVGLKTGGMLLFGGFESVAGTFYNLGNTTLSANFEINSSRWGLGLGGGGNYCLIFVFHCPSIWTLNGNRIDDWAINVSLGEKWGDFAKTAAKLRKVGKVASKIIANLDEIRNASSYIYNSVEAINSSDTHPVYTWDIPAAGAALELSAYQTRGRIWIKDLEF